MVNGTKILEDFRFFCNGDSMRETGNLMLEGLSAEIRGVGIPTLSVKLSSPYLKRSQCLFSKFRVMARMLESNLFGSQLP